MPLDLYLSVHFFHNSLFIDQECGSFRAHKRSTVETFLFPYAVEVQNFSFWVAEQSEGQLMFPLELLMRLDAVLAYT